MAAAARSGAKEPSAVQRLRDAERSRLSRLLHDETGPLLCAAGLTAELLRGTLPGVTPQQEELFAKLSGALESAVRSVRLLSQEAAPGLAARRGLEGALRLLAEGYCAELQIASTLRPLPPSRAEALCELVRDALLATEGGGRPARIAALADRIRVETARPLDPGIERALRRAARASGLRVRRRAAAEGAIMEIQLEENG